MNLAEVEYLDLDSVERLLVRFGNVKVLAGQAHDAGGVGYSACRLKRAQGSINQRRTNLAEVEYLALDSVERLLGRFGDVKGCWRGKPMMPVAWAIAHAD